MTSDTLNLLLEYSLTTFAPYLKCNINRHMSDITSCSDCWTIAAIISYYKPIIHNLRCYNTLDA